jgi:hypothetical protein
MPLEVIRTFLHPKLILLPMGVHIFIYTEKPFPIIFINLILLNKLPIIFQCLFKLGIFTYLLGLKPFHGFGQH